MMMALRRSVTLTLDKTREALLNNEGPQMEEKEVISLKHSVLQQNFKCCKKEVDIRKTGYLENLNHKFFSTNRRRYMVLEN